MFRDKAGDRISKTFCVLPWMHRFTNIEGEIQICCTAEEYDGDVIDTANTLGKGSDHKMNIQDIQDDQKIMNSQYMKDLRKTMLAGKWPKPCERCRVTESTGGHSRRILENNMHWRLIDDLDLNTNPDGSLKKVKVQSYDYRLGNTCNLSCRMCNPRSSSKWYKDWLKVDHEFFAQTQKELDYFKNFDWYNEPDVWKAFERQLPYVRHLHFAGGEPLFVKKHHEVLEMCVRKGYARNISLTYNTNLSLIPDACKELWPKFGALRIYISLDAVGKLNEYIRYPSKWNVIDKNMRHIDKNWKKYNIKTALVMATVQAYNILNLDDLYKYLDREFERILPIPHLMNLHHPYHYSTQILPPEIKAEAKAKLLAMQSMLRKKAEQRKLRFGQFSFYIESISEAIQFMELEDKSHLIPAFLKAAQSKDKFRNENLFDVIPEFKALEDYTQKSHVANQATELHL